MSERRFAAALSVALRPRPEFAAPGVTVKVREGEGAFATTRSACATQICRRARSEKKKPSTLTRSGFIRSERRRGKDLSVLSVVVVMKSWGCDHHSSVRSNGNG